MHTLEIRKGIKGNEQKLIVDNVFMCYGILCVSCHNPSVQAKLEALGFVHQVKRIERKVEPISTIIIPTGLFQMEFETFFHFDFINWSPIE